MASITTTESCEDQHGSTATLLKTAQILVFAGALATVAFDFFGQALAPILGYPSLAPVPLATQTWGVIFGEAYRPGGYLLHVLTGVALYPLGWLIWRSVVERIVPAAPWVLSAAVYGVALWVVALYGVAHLIAGNPPFLNFGALAWVALAGHVVYALVAAGAERRLR